MASDRQPQQPEVQQQQQQHAMHAPAQPAAVTNGAEGKKVKRHVALHVGYVGTQYTGLQANRQLPQLATVEGVLEAAILRAGLITEANFGDFRKTKWSRSSRTDKGVHSLATVIGLKILMHDEDYDTDPEGIKYARLINEHLPQDVCVFAVQRTNKGFNARRWCGNRTYEYYLPASVLGLETSDGSGPEDQARLALLREVLAAYVGYKPYHNYAGSRSQYVGQREKAQRRRERREARAASEASSEGLSSDYEAGAEAAAAAATAAAEQTPSSSVPDSTAGAAEGAAPRIPSSTDAEDGGESEAETAAEAALYAAAAAAYTGEGPVPLELQWRQQVRFLEAPDPSDPVVKSHYRMMRSFTADDPSPLVPGGVPCLRLEVCGDSFMLHQIRHMVGAAVAIVRGIMPRELLEMSLSAPGRVPLPRAPPHSLLLFGCSFSPFPAGWGLDTPLVARYTGDRLRLRERGQEMRQEFRSAVFDAAINELLQHPDWEVWSKQMLPRYTYAPEDVQAAVSQHRSWFTALKAKRAAAAEAKAVAQAATALEGIAAAAAVAGAAAAEAPGAGAA